MNTKLITNDLFVPSAQPGDEYSAVVGYERNGATHSALVNLQAKPVSATVAAKPTISSSTQTTSQGVRRVMLKFELDYNARGYDAAVQSGTFYDPTRSGRKVSAHVVFTIPKGMAEDMLGQNGGAVSQVANGQVDYLRTLLLAALLDNRSALCRASLALPYPVDGVLGGTTVPDGGTENLVTSERWSLHTDDFLRRGIAGLTPLDPAKDLVLRELHLHS